MRRLLRGAKLGPPLRHYTLHCIGSHNSDSKARASLEPGCFSRNLTEDLNKVRTKKILWRSRRKTFQAEKWTSEITLRFKWDWHVPEETNKQKGSFGSCVDRASASSLEMSLEWKARAKSYRDFQITVMNVDFIILGHYVLSVLLCFALFCSIYVNSTAFSVSTSFQGLHISDYLT